MSVVVVRVDSRLVHGQVIENWVPTFGIQSVVVVDAEASGNALTQMAMRMAVPAEIDLEVRSPESVDWDAVARDPHRTLVLVPTVAAGAAAARALRLEAGRVPLNVGVVQHTAERRPITPNVHLSSQEIEALGALSETGVPIEIRGLPNQPPLGLADVRARYLKAG